MMAQRIIAATLAVALVGFTSVAVALAQEPAPRPAPQAVEPTAELRVRDVAGTVKNVDAASRTVQVSSGMLGLFRTTLVVTEETRIEVQGHEATLADIKEGDQVKASYATQDGQSVARSIEVSLAPAGKP